MHTGAFYLTIPCCCVQPCSVNRFRIFSRILFHFFFFFECLQKNCLDAMWKHRDVCSWMRRTEGKQTDKCEDEKQKKKRIPEFDNWILFKFIILLLADWLVSVCAQWTAAAHLSAAFFCHRRLSLPQLQTVALFVRSDSVEKSLTLNQ